MAITLHEAKELTAKNENKWLEPFRQNVEKCIREAATKGLSVCNINITTDPDNKNPYRTQCLGNNIQVVSNELQEEGFDVDITAADTTDTELNLCIFWH